MRQRKSLYCALAGSLLIATLVGAANSAPAEASTWTTAPGVSAAAFDYNNYRALLKPGGAATPRGYRLASASFTIRKYGRVVATNVAAYNASPGIYETANVLKYLKAGKSLVVRVARTVTVKAINTPAVTPLEISRLRSDMSTWEVAATLGQNGISVRRVGEINDRSYRDTRSRRSYNLTFVGNYLQTWTSVRNFFAYLATDNAALMPRMQPWAAPGSPAALYVSQQTATSRLQDRPYPESLELTMSSASTTYSDSTGDSVDIYSGFKFDTESRLITWTSTPGGALAPRIANFQETVEKNGLRVKFSTAYRTNRGELWIPVKVSNIAPSGNRSIESSIYLQPDGEQVLVNEDGQGMRFGGKVVPGGSFYGAIIIPLGRLGGTLLLDMTVYGSPLHVRVPHP